MTINAIKFQSVIEAQINASDTREWAEDFAQIKKIHADDRRFDNDKKVWVIKNPERYANVPFVKKALEQSCLYLHLFY